MNFGTIWLSSPTFTQSCEVQFLFSSAYFYNFSIIAQQFILINFFVSLCVFIVCFFQNNHRPPIACFHKDIFCEFVSCKISSSETKEKGMKKFEFQRPNMCTEKIRRIPREENCNRLHRHREDFNGHHHHQLRQHPRYPSINWPHLHVIDGLIQLRWHRPQGRFSPSSPTPST